MLKASLKNERQSQSTTQYLLQSNNNRMGCGFKMIYRLNGTCIKSVCCTPKAHTMLRVNYISGKTIIGIFLIIRRGAPKKTDHTGGFNSPQTSII